MTGVRLPKPREGWCAFAGEVGVIVLGVLLALGAQQAVESWQVRRDVSAFRETIDREISSDLFTQDLREAQVDCELRRLGEVRAFLAEARSHKAMPAIFAIPLAGAAPYRGAWNSRDAETYRQLPADVRRRYAMFYDGLDNLQGSRETELAYWRQLSRFAEPGPVSLEERRDAQVAVFVLQRRIALARVNIDAERQIARDLGLKATMPEDLSASDVDQARSCIPISVAPQP